MMFMVPGLSMGDRKILSSFCSFCIPVIEGPVANFIAPKFVEVLERRFWRT